MRMLMWHCDSFRSEVTEKGRSPLRDTVEDPVVSAGECLLVYVAGERGDERDVYAVAKSAAAEITGLARQLKVATIVLLPFAHLFVELAPPEVALSLLTHVQDMLRAAALEVRRCPFGWFNTLEIRAKGHPISRVAREIRPE